MVLSGARVGTLWGSGWPSDGPPKPPSPRANREATSVASSSPFSFLSTVLCRITAPLSLPLSKTSSTVESAVICAATASGLWKVMSRSPSTTITRLRFISPGPAPHAATEANVGTTFSGRGVAAASLTKASSFSSRGSAPIPMPQAYSMTSRSEYAYFWPRFFSAISSSYLVGICDVAPCRRGGVRSVLSGSRRREERQWRATSGLEHHFDFLTYLQRRHVAVDEIGQQRRTLLERHVPN